MAGRKQKRERAQVPALVQHGERGRGMASLQLMKPLESADISLQTASAAKQFGPVKVYLSKAGRCGRVGGTEVLPR